MKRILFYFENEWAFGTIHNELCKYLWSHGFNCNILDWRIPYSLEEMQESLDITDYFVTSFVGWEFLKNHYKIPAEKTILIAHGRYDLEVFKNTNTTPLNLFHKIGAVSDWLIDVAKQIGIDRKLELVPLGINYLSFSRSKPNTELKTVGYAGAYKNQVFSTIKRVHLIEKIAEKVGLSLKIADSYHNSFVTMPGFYKNVDAIICASTEEGAGLPVLEGGAAGKLILSTNVGHWYSKVGNSGGILLPIDETFLIEEAVKILSYYKNNPEEYYKKCKDIQKHAENYDWKNVIKYWIDILS